MHLPAKANSLSVQTLMANKSHSDSDCDEVYWLFRWTPCLLHKLFQWPKPGHTATDARHDLKFSSMTYVELWHPKQPNLSTMSNIFFTAATSSSPFLVFIGKLHILIVDNFLFLNLDEQPNTATALTLFNNYHSNFVTCYNSKLAEWNQNNH